ncbi:hypothetical protein P153DRAFT_340543 [Dothidotthia symphoricarpi CBS 119687]|uniref:Xylanolytic transcriptional activator regulatory domain-containing protein n=1 Tax=Dothidotthia symphoricarpi CBS 119687 TaxID=1392245 RepID=A0A6A6AEN3_9PLEO|nr:uncharacterized protein P153DRAFT_340543 [Dothidotthia symphoricarpi CBS 119687]KAF2129565.1 hypothetical protein P153DRAFT_340543 [Dothidotthia symphoricarpi CBS 119687]
MMNPHMAEDITVLEQYLSSQAIEGNAAAKLYNTVSSVPGQNPIVYLTVPRRRKGLASAVDPGRVQREIIEQILSPFAAEVRKTYFNHLHPCFPIVDEKTFADMWHKNNDRISSTLLCDMYASALSFWKSSEILRQHPRPDPHFIWNQAVAALQDDFMAPTISTVHAALLDMIGRPVIQVTGNIVNAGRVVTLAQSLGLHRDPTLWKATAHEKSVRIRIWWGVLIHDYWSSISHGNPPLIHSRFYDVPVPSLEVLATSRPSESHQRAASSFIYLCKLSRILGEVLPFVYSLEFDSVELWRNLRKIECSLDDWLLELPEFLRLSAPSTNNSVNGSSNLWFSYLSVKVLLCRLAFKATLKDPKPPTPETRQYRLAMLREAASEVTDFVTSLTEAQLEEFWMPYTSYLLVTTATILLRCTVECGDIETKKLCTTKLVDFNDRLQRAREVGWDLAEFCLDRCSEPIQKIANALGILPRITESQTRVTDQVDNGLVLDRALAEAPAVDTTSMPDFFLPIDSLDYPWETLWDTFEGPWPIQI